MTKKTGFSKDLDLTRKQRDRDVEIIANAFASGQHVPTVHENKTSGNDGGIDYTARYADGSELYIDMKQAYRIRGSLWVCLETWSKMPSDDRPSGIVGWTLDTSKATDYLIFVEPRRREWVRARAPILRAAFLRNVDIWADAYGRRQNRRTVTDSGDEWISEFIKVPWSDIEFEMRAIFALADAVCNFPPAPHIVPREKNDPNA